MLLHSVHQRGPDYAQPLNATNSFLRRCEKLACRDRDSVSITYTVFQETDDSLFRKVVSGSQHLRQRYGPERSNDGDPLRKGSHNHCLIHNR